MPLSSVERSIRTRGQSAEGCETKGMDSARNGSVGKKPTNQGHFRRPNDSSITYDTK
jgi:hypothetical protein